MPVLLIRVAAGVVFLFGIITFPMPLPTGLVAIVLSIAMFASTSAWMSGKLKMMRSKYRFLDEKLESIEPYVPESIKRTIRESRPINDTSTGPLENDGTNAMARERQAVDDGKDVTDPIGVAESSQTTP